MLRILYQIALYVSFCFPFLTAYLLRKIHDSFFPKVAASTRKKIFYSLAVISMVAGTGLFHVSMVGISTEIQYTVGSMLFSRKGHIRENGMIVGDYIDETLLNSLDKNYIAVHQEIFIRLANPFVQDWDCSDSDPEICKLTDEIFPQGYMNSSIAGGLLYLVFITALSLVSTKASFQRRGIIDNYGMGILDT